MAALWQCDRVLHAGERHLGAARPAAAAVGRDPAPTFVLFVDSLRWQTAMDPQIMPALAALRAEGAWAKMNTVYQAHTVPAMRAIFTGETTSGVFNVITDFRRTNLELASLFSELAAAGRHSVVWSSGQFAQFGATVEQRFVHPFLQGSEGDVYLQRDRRRVADALRVFAEGGHALVIAHIEFTDYEAHQFGVAHPEYRQAFGHADALIAQAAQAVHPPATLLVIGDHGHDERGAHKAGLDIPTFVVGRGPGFRAGVDFGTIDITDAGYLLRAALHAPANRGRHAHVALDRALVAGTEPPALGAVAGSDAAGRKMSWVTLATLALLAVMAWRGWSGGEGWSEGAAWLALAVSFVPGDGAGWLAAGLAVGAVGGAARRERRLGPAVGATALALGLIGGGTLLVQAPGALPPATWLLQAGLLGLMGWTWRRPEAERVWWLAAAAALAGWGLEPWLHAAGWWGATYFAGLGLVWLTLVPVRREPWAAAAVAVMALAFASFYQRDSAGHWAFATPVTMAHIVPIAIAGGAAKFLVLRGLAPKSGWGAVAALPIAVGLGAYAWQVDRSMFDLHPRVAGAVLIGVCGGGLLVAWLAGARRWRPLLGGALVYALFEHGVRAQPFHFAWADIFFAGIYLAARLATTEQARAALGLGGVALSYAAVQGWYAGGVEWQALYDWFPAELVEMRVGWFLPWILFRETLPLWLVGLLVVAGSGQPWPGRAIARLVAGWMLGLTLVMAGHFSAAPAIEATQLPAEQLGALAVLMVATCAIRWRAGDGTEEGPISRWI